VILNLRYTAREGGGDLKQAAKDELPKPGARLFSLKHEFSTEWYHFLTTTDGDTANHIQKFALRQDRFPFYLRSETQDFKSTCIRHAENCTTCNIRYLSYPC